VAEFGYSQVSNGDEVSTRPEAARGAFGLLQQAVHRLHEGIAAMIEHPTDHRIKVAAHGGGELLEGLEPASPRSSHPRSQVSACTLVIVVFARGGIHRAQPHL